MDRQNQELGSQRVILARQSQEKLTADVSLTLVVLAVPTPLGRSCNRNMFSPGLVIIHKYRRAQATLRHEEIVASQARDKEHDKESTPSPLMLGAMG